MQSSSTGANAEAQAIMQAIGLDAGQIQQRKHYLRIGNEDVERLRQLAPVVEQHSQAAIDKLYEHMLSEPETRAKLGDEANIRRLKAYRSPHNFSILDDVSRYSWPYHDVLDDCGR